MVVGKPAAGINKLALSQLNDETNSQVEHLSN